MHALDLIFQALSDSTRRTMVQRLASGPLSVSRLAEPFSISMPAVTKHLSVLERAEIITKKRKGKNVVCELNPTKLKSAEEWISSQREYWTRQLDSFEDFVRKEEQKRKR